MKRDKLGRIIPEYDRKAASRKRQQTIEERYGRKEFFKKLGKDGGKQKTRGYFGKLKDEDPKELIRIANHAAHTKKQRKQAKTEYDSEEVWPDQEDWKPDDSVDESESEGSQPSSN